MTDREKAFDFGAQEQAAVTAYLKCHRFYEDLASTVKRILEETLHRRGVKVHSVQARAKDPASFGQKAAQPSEVDPTKPKYSYPLEQIVTVQVVKTGITPQRVLSDRFREAETEPLPPAKRPPMQW
jgi:hypothetical protein